MVTSPTLKEDDEKGKRRSRAYALRREITLESLSNPFERFFRLRKHPARQAWAMVYDSYVWSLWQEGRALLQARNRMWLATGNGAVLQMERGKPGRFVSEMPDSPLRRRLRKALGLRALRQVGRLEWKESRWELRDLRDATKRVGQLRIRELPGEPRLFVELETFSDEADQADQAQVILEAIASPEATSLIEEGLGQRGIRPKAYALKPEVALEPGQQTREVILAIARKTLKVARSNEEGVVNDWDTEFLHDFRICLRRMRSLLASIKEVYPEEPLQRWRETLAEISRRTNRVRDLDVALLSREKNEALLPPPLREGLSEFFATQQEERAVAFEALRAYLLSPEYDETVSGLAKEWKGASSLPATEAGLAPVLEQASLRIAHRLGQLLKRSGRLTATSPDEEIHEVRILGKKLRYLLEFFGALYPEEEAGPLGKQLGKVQKVLGRFNDASVQQMQLLDFHKNRSEPLHPPLAMALGGLITAMYLRHEQQRREVRDALCAFAESDATRRFRRRLKQSLKQAAKLSSETPLPSHDAAP